MVADTHSSIGQLVIPAWAGALIGALAGAAFTLVAKVPLASAIPGLVACAVLGIFFALCQHRTTLLGYLMVGFFFGFNCWILTKVVMIFNHNLAWPLTPGSTTSLKHCILFGEILAIAALLLGSMQSGVSDATLPKD